MHCWMEVKYNNTAITFLFGGKTTTIHTKSTLQRNGPNLTEWLVVLAWARLSRPRPRLSAPAARSLRRNPGDDKFFLHYSTTSSFFTTVRQLLSSLQDDKCAKGMGACRATRGGRERGISGAHGGGSIGAAPSPPFRPRLLYACRLSRSTHAYACIQVVSYAPRIAHSPLCRACVMGITS